jgi:SnoaL-like domain
MLNYAVARSPRGSCTISTSASSLLIEFTKAYFEQVDNGRLPDELFTPDFEFYFPKYGVGRGLEEFREFATGLASAGHKATHHRDRLKYIACGQQVIVEGTTFGTDGEGNTWDGGETAGGRFCSVFDFTEDGFIKRMYIYLDPDYTSRDTDRFHWRRGQPRW